MQELGSIFPGKSAAHALARCAPADSYSSANIHLYTLLAGNAAFRATMQFNHGTFSTFYVMTQSSFHVLSLLMQSTVELSLVEVSHIIVCEHLTAFLCLHA